MEKMKMITIIARLKVTEGKDDEFKAVFAKLSAAVRDNEEGCSFYQLTSTRTSGEYVVVERYADKDAIKAHATSAHFAEAGPGLVACLAGAHEIEQLHDV